ncbi:hypothetical protein M446_5963 [Methylobacterium sp. 4-46]|uniref:hypothetical protein n=1 Tax=unclassified Methylobacterium TaxID=2615210 RepID=UPI000152E717|nr:MULTISPECIES: hypothetical protein [Methylobacterium]ACA20243.1 hypothetical protein M446_5963 [Methylobacterium sp. 4-46]WFT79419.1 hypothetical protein QA634_30100 [Methylobacterium nodulans]
MDRPDSLAALLAAAADPLCRDGLLHRAREEGGFADVPVRCRVEALGAGEEAPGLPGRRISLMLLLPGLDPPPTPEDEITLPEGRWRITAVERDPAGSHLLLQGRPA